MHLYLVHHGDAVGPEVDTRRPLSITGRDQADRVAREAARRGVKPAVVWHSGKLRAKQTAESCWRACNALAELSAVRDIQPGDPPWRFVDRLAGETRDILVAGHFPHLPELLGLLTGAGGPVPFPAHGMVALVTDDEGTTWREEWRIEPG